MPGQGEIFGGAAHGGGTAKARQLGETRGVVASLVMMMAGLFNVLAAPLIRQIFFKGVHRRQPSAIAKFHITTVNNLLRFPA